MAGSPSRPTATTTGKAVAPTSGGLFLRVALHSGERWGDNPDRQARGACRRGWSVCFASSAFMASAAIRGSASMAHPVGARPRTLPRRHECIVPLPWAAWLAQTAQLMRPSTPSPCDPYPAPQVLPKPCPKPCRRPVSQAGCRVHVDTIRGMVSAEEAVAMRVARRALAPLGGDGVECPTA
jgi:hypothetical protein